MYIADFETTSEIPTKVWLWSVAEVETDLTITGETIQSFMEWILEHGANTIVYFHNLRFDGYFILNWLFENKYEYVEENPGRRQFTTLISDKGIWYSIQVSNVKFYDSLKVLPMPVRDIPKAFNLDIEKLELDYLDYTVTDDAKQYAKNDVLIVAKAIKELREQGMTKMTTGSNAFSTYKSMVGRFTNLFPQLDPTVDEFCRHAYFGGIAYCPARVIGKKIGAGRVYDVNSMYPWAMRECLMPQGEATYFTGKPPDGKLWIAEIIIDIKLKPGKIPCIASKGFRGQLVGFIEDIDEPIKIHTTSVDLLTIFDSYTVHKITFIEGYWFTGTKHLFDEYVDFWMDVKANSKGGKRTIAKLMLNSLYGKFATNPNITRRHPYRDEFGCIKLYKGKDEFREPVYVPVGCFITAWARWNLVTTANKCPNFLYCDTDSIHLEGDFVPDINIHENKLGAWKLEAEFTRAKYLRPKCYIEEIEGKFKVTIAGLPISGHANVTWDNFKIGATYEGKLLPKVVPGGVVLEKVTYTIGA